MTSKHTSGPVMSKTQIENARYALNAARGVYVQAQYHLPLSPVVCADLINQRLGHRNKDTLAISVSADEARAIMAHLEKLVTQEARKHVTTA